MSERRTRSLAVAANLGCSKIPIHFPELDDHLRLRPTDEVMQRALGLHVVVAVAFGFDPRLARSWLEGYVLPSAITPDEMAFLHLPSTALIPRCRAKVEALYALGWSLQRTAEMNFAGRPPDDLYKAFPNLKDAEAPERFLADAGLRSIDEISDALDLSYCLHWCVTQARLDGRALPKISPAYAIVERRRALEWLVGKGDWDNISLDT